MTVRLHLISIHGFPSMFSGSVLTALFCARQAPEILIILAFHVNLRRVYLYSPYNSNGICMHIFYGLAATATLKLFPCIL